ncbi:hypothetical protein FN846DRAFT_140416 [Sphaerosporella brunnea]|uniref:Transmembrane protein n=1 Tax=Sphaerosporella brunnea TaxID=1250544 RepID=A0A5J5ERK1_9PEZI|nr:hypothetical protein FN846DRAFT_140416 [Sphaerosporella brunnea]
MQSIAGWLAGWIDRASERKCTLWRRVQISLVCLSVLLLLSALPNRQPNHARHPKKKTKTQSYKTKLEKKKPMTPPPPLSRLAAAMLRLRDRNAQAAVGIVAASLGGVYGFQWMIVVPPTPPPPAEKKMPDMSRGLVGRIFGLGGWGSVRR